MWFTILECGFKASKIKNSLTKFAHAVSLLPPDVLPQVSDAISAASTFYTPYDDMKTALLKNLQSSIANRLKELFSKEDLDNEKSTELLRRMKQLLGDKYHSFDTDVQTTVLPTSASCYSALPFQGRGQPQPDAIAKLTDDFMATKWPQSIHWLIPLNAHLQNLLSQTVSCV